TIHHLEPGRGVLVDFDDLTATEFPLSAGPYPESSRRDKPRTIEDLRPQREQQAKLSAPHSLSAGAIRELEAGFQEVARRRSGVNSVLTMSSTIDDPLHRVRRSGNLQLLPELSEARVPRTRRAARRLGA